MSRYGNECNIQTTSTSEKDDLQVKGKTSHVPSRESFKNKWVCMKYGTFLISGMSLAIFLQTTPAEWLPVLLPKYCPEAACTRTQAVYRISFSLFIFYLIHFLVANKYNRLLSVAARRFFVEWWMAWKIVPFGMLFAMSIFLPSSFFMWYGWFSLAASCMFLLLQVIVLIDFAYELSERWIRNAESAEDVRVSKAWLAAIVIVSLLLVVGSYSAYGVLLYLFACSVARGGLLVSFLLNTTGIVMSIASPHGNIFPSGVVAAYTLTLCFSALTSMVPREGCQLRNGGYGVLSSVYFNCFIAAISVTRASLSVAHARDAFTLKPSEVEKVDYTEDMSNEEQEDTEMISAYSFFFGVMMLASCYIAMLMTSWDLYSIQSNTKVHMMDKSDVAMWLKFSCSWLASLLYIWSLIAPYVLPHRF